MTLPVHLALIGWIPVVLVLFALMRPRRAVISAFLIAWLFLPVAGYAMPALPDYTKITATSYGVLLGVLLFDAGRLLQFRPSWIDLPAVVWCLVPLASSISNGLGIYDGASGVMDLTTRWGVPYFIGRLYFSDLEGLRELAVGIFISGLVYVPLCLFEMRMSPQLHPMFYGFHPRGNFNVYRFGGYRPRVFMESGLALGMWMTAASLIGVWLWQTGAMRRLRQVPMSLLVPVLLVTTVLCKATGALVLLFGGLAVLFLTKWVRSPVFLAGLIAVPIGYIAVRSTSNWSGRVLIDAAALVSEERARSLQGRLENEDILAEKAWQRPVVGWGGWGRSRVYDEKGKDISTTDGIWIIAFGEHGLVGLVSIYALMLLPAVLLVWRVPAAQWAWPSFAPLVGLAVLLALVAVDQLLNGMPNPVFFLCAGGVSGVAARLRRRSIVLAVRQASRLRGRVAKVPGVSG